MEANEKIEPPQLHCRKCGVALNYYDLHFLSARGGECFHPVCLAEVENESGPMEGYWFGGDGFPPDEYTAALKIKLRVRPCHPDEGRWSAWHELLVPIGNGEVAAVAMREWLGGLPRVEYGELPPEVAARYELRNVVTTFLVRKGL
jgi:hypothetical protein